MRFMGICDTNKILIAFYNLIIIKGQNIRNPLKPPLMVCAVISLFCKNPFNLRIS
nr:MAG TPA: hypothetical protein [Caudoviricetes sp.]